MHSLNIIRGKAINPKSAMIMVHGRGGSARDMLSLTPHLQIKDCLFVAPEATGGTWYPYSFIAPVNQNQPWLDSALDILHQTRQTLHQEGFADQDIYFLGFSQGACLTLEYTARHAAHYAGIIAFTGGLIGDILTPENYRGDFAGTPIFISTGDPDPHVPLSRVQDSVGVLSSLQASVELLVLPGRAHTITGEEITAARDHLF